MEDFREICREPQARRFAIFIFVSMLAYSAQDLILEPFAGSVFGMTPGQSMRRIVLPQAIKRMIPALMNQSIIQFKNTSLVSVLAVPDLVYQSQVAAHDSYRPLETYTAVAVAYAAILIPLTIIVRRGEKRLAVAE